MKKIINSTIILLFFLSCKSSENRKVIEIDDSIEILNKDFIEAITDYQDFLFKDNMKLIERGDSVYVGICSKYINDNIYRYVLFPVSSVIDLHYLDPFSLCKLNGHYVVMSYSNAYRPYSISFCKNTNVVSQRYSQLLFPKGYKESRKQTAPILRIYEPDNCYLTFIGDSLIDKTLKCGSPNDKIPVMLNGREVYL